MRRARCSRRPALQPPWAASRGDPARRGDPHQRDDEGRGRAAAGGRPVGQDAEGHLQPQLLLARHVRGARGRDRRCPLERPGRELAGRRRPPHARPGQPAARLGRDQGRQAGRERAARNPTADPAYGFDAVRTLIRYAEDPSPEGRSSPPAPGLRRGAPARRHPGRVDAQRQAGGKTQHPVALVAAAAAADAAGRTADKEKLLDAAAGLDRGNPTYYGAAWVALGG